MKQYNEKGLLAINVPKNSEATGVDDTIIIARLNLREQEEDADEQDLKFQTGPKWFRQEEIPVLFKGRLDNYRIKSVKIYSTKLVLSVSEYSSDNPKDVICSFTLTMVPSTQNEKRFRLSLYLAKWPEKCFKQVTLYCGINPQSSKVEFEVLRIENEPIPDYSPIPEQTEQAYALTRAARKQMEDFIADAEASKDGIIETTNLQPAEDSAKKLAESDGPAALTKNVKPAKASKGIPELGAGQLAFLSVEYKDVIKMLESKYMLINGRASKASPNMVECAEYILALHSIVKKPQELRKCVIFLSQQYKFPDIRRIEEFLGASTTRWINTSQELLK